MSKQRAPADLAHLARKVRRLSLIMIHGAGMGHPGGALSVVELLVALYFRVMRIAPARPTWRERDRLVFSKGHACAALYAVLALRGYFPESDLKELGRIDSHLQSHPDKNKTPGLDASSGALGQGLSLAVGMALAARMRGRDYTVYALLGDGECDCGQIWEAAMAASHLALGNLVAVVDANRMQAKGTCREIMAIEPLAEKWAAFRWNVTETDGHDLDAVTRTLTSARERAGRTGRPVAVLAHTVKGRGVSFMENVTRWHNAPPTDQELEAALKELDELRELGDA